MAYALGAVKPFVQDVADQVGERFKLSVIYGWRADSVDMTGHPAGLALDFPVATDKTKGDALASYFISNASALQVKYVIWQQAIWTPSTGAWKAMETRSGAGDVNHLRHVHVSFNPVVADGRRLGVAPAGDGTLRPPKSADGTGVDRAEKDGPSNILEQAIMGLGNLTGDAAAALANNPAAAAAATFARLSSRDTWVRIAQVVGGALLIWGGVGILVRDAAMPVISAVAGATPQGRAVKGVAAGATAADAASKAVKATASDLTKKG